MMQAVKRCTIAVLARSSIHDIRAETSLAQGTIQTGVSEKGDLVLDALEISADLATLKTGDLMKDLELRRRLGDGIGGKAEFGLRGALTESLGALAIRGDLTFRGHTKALVCEARILARGPVIARAKFGLRLTEFGLEPPKILFLKIRDEVEITVEVTA